MQVTPFYFGSIFSLALLMLFGNHFGKVRKVIFLLMLLCLVEIVRIMMKI